MEEGRTKSITEIWDPEIRKEKRKNNLAKERRARVKRGYSSHWKSRPTNPRID